MSSIENGEGRDGAFILVASVAIVSPADNTVVVVERKPDLPRNSSKIELPGGKHKNNERSHEVAARREVREELGDQLPLVPGIWNVARLDSLFPLEDGRTLSIRRGIYPLAGLPPEDIELCETHSHVRAYFLDDTRFSTLASPGIESGNFVPGLEDFLWRIFQAAKVRGTIIDALSPGVNLTLHPVILSPEGDNVLVNTNKLSPLLKVGSHQHIDDVLRKNLAFVFSLGSVQRNLIRWNITMEQLLHTISASFGLILFSPKVIPGISLPSDTVWLPRESSEFVQYVTQHRGFMREFLGEVANLQSQDLVGSKRAVSMRGARTSVRPGPMDK